MNDALQIKVRQANGVPIIELSGDVDSYTCPQLRAAIMDLIERGQFKMVVNMASVRYIDSSGLGTIVGGLRRVAEREGRIALAEPSQQVKRVLTITGLVRILDLFEDEQDAVESFIEQSTSERQSDL